MKKPKKFLVPMSIYAMKLQAKMIKTFYVFAIFALTVSPSLFGIGPALSGPLLTVRDNILNEQAMERRPIKKAHRKSVVKKHMESDLKSLAPLKDTDPLMESILDGQGQAGQ